MGLAQQHNRTHNALLSLLVSVLVLIISCATKRLPVDSLASSIEHIERLEQKKSWTWSVQIGLTG